MLEHTSRTNIKSMTGTTVRQRYTDRHNVAPIRSQLPSTATLELQQLRRHRQSQRSRNCGLPAARTRDLQSNPTHWLLSHNPSLASSISAAIGDRWIAHQEDLQQLIPLADDPVFQSRWQAVKRAHKQILADAIDRELGVEIAVDSLFDLQLQPICDRQRQLLNILHIITLYHQIKTQPDIDIVPRTVIFGNLTTSADRHETIANSIAAVAELVDDPAINSKLQVVYLPDTAELTDRIYRAADLNEQIATAGSEDPDRDWLKFSLNGALSIASMSKANHLLQQAVGVENCFCFGLSIPEITLFKERGYDPYNYYNYYPEIRQAIDLLSTGLGNRALSSCRAIVDLLLDPDEYMVLADYPFYRTCQARVSATYRDRSRWTRMSILNVAGLG